MKEKGEIEEITRERADSFGSEVSLIEGTTCREQFREIAIRLFLSAIVFAALAGALIWSFIKGETGVVRDINERNSEYNFSVFVNQFADVGRQYDTIRGEDGTNQEPETHVYHSFWYQDDDNKRLIHRVYPTLTIYAFETFAYYVNTTFTGDASTGCVTRNDVNYTSYINRLGLTNLMRPHEESIRLKNRKSVYVYQGEPAKVRLPNTNSEAFLLLAYADVDTGALLGWDTYFSASNSSRLFKREYWFGTMIPASSDSQILNQIPILCIQQGATVGPPGKSAPPTSHGGIVAIVLAFLLYRQF